MRFIGLAFVTVGGAAVGLGLCWIHPGLGVVWSGLMLAVAGGSILSSLPEPIPPPFRRSAWPEED
jgi:hypothetical protein